MVITMGVYWQVSGFEFINVDDPRYVLYNNFIRDGISLDGIKWAFLSVYAANWHPLTWLSHMLDIELFGMRPGMHHLINAALHTLNASLLFLVLDKMTGKLLRSAAIAALFALHPLHVESVAWISERKDVLSTFFGMLTMMSYYWYTRRENIQRYLLMILFYVLGLLSKPMLVTLPFVLLLLDCWPLKRFETTFTHSDTNSSDQQKRMVASHWPRIMQLVLEKIPLMVLAVLSSLITLYAQQSWGAVGSLERISVSTRIANAATSYVVYLIKMFRPVDLAAYYPYPETVNLPLVVFCLLVLSLITGIVLFSAKRIPYLLVGWFWYLGTLVPVIGIVQVGTQSMADRYTYFPLIGIFLMVVWWIGDFTLRLRHRKVILGVMSSVLFGAIITTTWVQVGYWKDSETLFRHAIDVTRDNYNALGYLGLALYEKGDLDGAILCYRETLSLNPAVLKNYINLGIALLRNNEIDSAINNYSDVLSIDPNFAEAHLGMGTALSMAGKHDLAEKHFQEVIRIDPDSSEARNSLGDLMGLDGNLDLAVQYYTESLKINPHQSDVYNNLGMVFLKKGDMSQAIECFQAAVKENPAHEAAAVNLMNAKSKLRVLEEKVAEIRVLLHSDEHNPVLNTQMGDIYRQIGRYDEAAESYSRALSVQPEFMQAMFGLVIVSTERKEYAQALQMLQSMKDIQPDNADIYYNISCLYAKQNMVDQSVDWLKQSIDKGFRNWELIRNDPDLRNIRDIPYVKGLMSKSQNSSDLSPYN